MSLTGALNNALSGLYANSRKSELVASNIANVGTPGFRRRSLDVSAALLGDQGGVKVNGVVRHTDSALLHDRRMSSAEFARNDAMTRFLAGFEDRLGTPDVAYSLSGRLATFENTLITAASRPDAQERLDGVVIAAKSLAQSLKATSDAIQADRTHADREIDIQVNTANDLLSQLQAINGQIAKSGGRARDNAALQDHRDLLVDQLSQMIPLRTVSRAHGAIAIYSTGGAVLLDGSAAEIGFEPTYSVAAGMEIDPGALSGLTINGKAIATGSETSPLRGGSLIAQFAIRDEMAPEAQTQLDALARDLIERFQNISEDTTRAPGDPGLFTDQGVVFDSLNEVGLSGRIAIHAAVDPDTGGESWRMRDGVNAVAQGEVGNASLLQAMTDALHLKQPVASGNFGAGSFSLAGLAASLTSQVGSDRLFADQRLSFASTQLNELIQRELADGVDTDAELQRLMVIEQAYAANARIIETVDELMDILMRL
ncbi:flagellar hook-associated protein FlgK [Pseudosulfitobacter sp. DSM 107133]|uniref:flagellar hook-associated protein FlgK n=1 Tax=Pseudosulfitobacter sp. DSM 107133 TaxID=2883100 RepID=UPI000DF30CB5|nr:flagellar hook-associated protein FlgK [Pseudosulfitobacter sp. DSM 107133]UOA28799.1 Flagellar hook-associated protein 1 [Pseudosulfitobacter sp. DSM 107133]